MQIEKNNFSQFGFGLIEVLVVLAAFIVITAGGVVVWKERVKPIAGPTPIPSFLPTASTPSPALNPSSRTSSVLPPFATEIRFEDLESSLLCISTGLLRYKYGEKEFIINTQEEYQSLYAYKEPTDSCKDYRLPEIDFTQKTLLGKCTTGGGCSIDFVRKIYQNYANKGIVYSITVIEEGFCKKGRISMNWALVPKISSDYTVRFEVQ